jgi:D-aminopeptidase
VRFAEGAAAGYGFGLSRRAMLGRAVTGHGGALRGWRSQRAYAPAERISVVVLFNHLSDAGDAAMALFAAALGEERPRPASDQPAPPWLGAYVEPETGLAARIEAAAKGRVRLRFGQSDEMLDLNEDGTAGTPDGRLRPGDGGLWMDRAYENQSSRLRPCDGDAARDIAGRYRCEELEAGLTIADAGGALYGACSGFLGQGRMEQLEPIGADVWALPCPRALDHSPPGDWTLAFQRDAAGRVAGIELGCWLARRLPYARIG